MENRYDKYKDSGIAWIGEIPEPVSYTHLTLPTKLEV